MQIVHCMHSFDDTVLRIKNFFSENSLKLFAEIDHGEEAQLAGLELVSTKVLVFGNPKAGTFLMQDDIHIAIELPLKVLVFEKEGKCQLAYKKPTDSLVRYQLKNHGGMLGKMDVLMEKIASQIS